MDLLNILQRYFIIINIHIKKLKKGYEPWKLRYTKKDSESLDRKATVEKIKYDKHDG